MARPQELLRTTDIKRQHMLQTTGPTCRKRINNTVRAMKRRTRFLLTTIKTWKVKGITNNSRSNAVKISWIKRKMIPACKRCMISNYNSNHKSKCMKSYRRQLMKRNCNSNLSRWPINIMLMIVVLEMLVPVLINLSIVVKTIKMILVNNFKSRML